MELCGQETRDRERVVTADLPHVGGGVFLSAHLRTDGSSPTPTPDHGVHRRGDLLLTGVRAGARLQLGRHLLGFLLRGGKKQICETEIGSNSPPSGSLTLNGWTVRNWAARPS